MSEPITPRLTSLPAPQRRLWAELGATPPEFVLYGGTAIALHLGHRVSVDFDFFSTHAFDPTQLSVNIAYLEGAEIQRQAPNTLTCLVHRKGPVSVSYSGLPRLRRLRPPHVASDTGLRIASLLDLAATKAHAVQGRAEAKDYVDIDRLITHGNLDLPTILAAAGAALGAGFNPMPTLKALAYFDDPGLRTLPASTRKRLAQAVRQVNPADLPLITAHPDTQPAGPRG